MINTQFSLSKQYEHFLSNNKQLFINTAMGPQVQRVPNFAG
jgi:hypothetical protein